MISLAAQAAIASSSVSSGSGPPVAIFLDGQSNAGNQDATPGTIDARVSLSWNSMYGITVDGPGPMRLQTASVSTGHSFEWQCSSDLASYFNNNIIVGKHWADGTIVSYFLPATNLHWPYMVASLSAFAAQCNTAGVTQVEFGWCQGEANTNASLGTELATYEADTSTLFDAIKALLATFGLSTHFTIIKTNINIPTSGGGSAAFLDVVRAAQEHLAVVRSDTSIINADAVTTPGTLHYGGGQTNTVGSIWANDIKTRHTGAGIPDGAMTFDDGSFVVFDDGSFAVTA